MARLNHRERVGFGSLMAAAMLAAGCAHLPWRHNPPPPPAPVSELTETAETGAAVDYPQYWKRNTLLVDLRGISAEGGIVLQPRSGTEWPVRVAFRVTPGSIGVLEVRGEERVILPVAAGGGAPIDLELPPDIYKSTTTHLTVHWSPR
jgi:hypothetical protein